MKWPWQKWFKGRAAKPEPAPVRVSQIVATPAPLTEAAPTHAVVEVAAPTPVALLYLSVDFEEALFREFFEQQHMQVVVSATESTLAQRVRDHAGALVVTDAHAVVERLRASEVPPSIIYIADQNEEAEVAHWKDTDFIVTRPVDAANPMGFMPV